MLEVSIMDHGHECTRVVQDALDQFMAEQRCETRLRVLPWRGSWAELVRIGLYNDGPNVSEVGSTWVSDLASMNALRSYTRSEIAQLGGTDRLLKTPEPNVLTWSIPWSADIRLIHYRCDLFERAGLNPATQFPTPQSVLQAVAQLQRCGIEMPIVLPTKRSRMTLHNLSSWVWGAGGDFAAPTMKSVVFNSPEAKAAIQAYFDLGQYLSPAARDCDESRSDMLYATGQAALTISGQWLGHKAIVSSEVLANSQHVLPPGAPYAGGTHFVIWKHTRQTELALKLIQCLVSPQTELRLLQETPVLPVQIDLYSQAPFHDQPLYQTVRDGLQAGRAFVSHARWGLIETKLTEVLADIWTEILAHPHSDSHVIVDQRLDEAAVRLNSTLSAY